MAGKLVALTGAARSGKDTLANILVADHAFIKMSFASPIRSFIASCCNTTVEGLEQIKEDPHPMLCGKSPRYAMQTLGTEWGRQMIGNEFWIRLCVMKANEMTNAGLNVVISDARFDNEAEAVKGMGGTVVKIVRPDYAKISESQHASEGGIKPSLIDAVIINDSEPEDMMTRLECLYV